MKIDSIDDIVEKYNPILKRSNRHEFDAERVESKLNSKLSPNGPFTKSNVNHPSRSRSRTVSDHSDDSHSSINSLTREALRLQPLIGDKIQRSPSSSPHLSTADSPSRAILPASRSLEESIKVDGSQRSSLKPSPSDTHARHSLTQSTEVEDEIAVYLRSTKLTTLIRLEHQQSPMTVSLADVGSSTGRPVFVYLGLGCVRYLVGLYDELAEALGLRLICIDRWGLGKTTEVPDEQRGFLEWADVVEEVADQLGISKFSILAHSAGAPYALAASLRLGDRVHGSIHLLAPWVSMTAEGGINAGAYRWLKYIPNSMIKTVQAAEWKMTGWRLGKPPSLNHPPVGFDARASTAISKNGFDKESSDDELMKRCSEEEEQEVRLSLQVDRRGDEPKEDPRRADDLTLSRMSIDSEVIAQWDRLSSEDGSRLHNPFLAPLPIDPSTHDPRRHHNHYHKSTVGPSKKKTSVPPRASNRNSDCSSIWSRVDHHHHHHLPHELRSPRTTSSVARDRDRDANHTIPPVPHLGSVISPPSPIGSGESVEDSLTSHRKDGNLSVNNKRMSQKFKSDRSTKMSNSSFEIDRRTFKSGCSTSGSSQSALRASQGSNRPQSSGKNENQPLGGGDRMTGKMNHGGSSRQTTDETFRRSLGISLLRASYSESLRGGTSDLITILEKNSKPWGFSYSEIDKPVKIWHGDKDERLSFKGSQWFLDSISKPNVKNRSDLFLVKNGSHSLMTNVNVLYQVFESISDEWIST